MHVTVRYFALVREITGKRTEEREVPEGTTAGELLDRIVIEYPAVERLRRASMLMVNQEYVQPDHVLAEGDEVALIPPVSGGSGPFRVIEEPIDLPAVTREVADPGAGAIATFVGTVRNTARGRDVLYLDYEAYPAAAEKMLARIGDEIADRWGIDRVAITHRIGRLEIGEASVAIAVSSPHRNEAFEACHYAIERIKQIVPIWKKEYYAGGDVWIGSEAAYQEEFGRFRES
ncbi:molybdopterin converting factor subunit 1 [Nitrolancea hollandica]|uniref:Molybdopterin synthase catalytic subunit n=1 Tax=Nitrolancea hollandica Lb TaxID=1129897 RepID=I4EE09_9BACT|nr:molybdopterin converting factor subunit 1 [Nitrolancea hollandica]CCF82921.1 MoaD family protein [Nitrolancea hollandica Lb]